MAEKEEIYPEGYPRQTESFSDNQKFKYDVFEAIKEVALESSKKAFEDKGYKQKEGAAGEYGTGEKYGKGTELHHFNIRLSSRPNTNTYFEKIIYFGGKEYIIEVSIGWDAKNKTIELAYKTPESGAFRGYGSDEGAHLVNGRFNFVIDSVAEFKKDIKKMFDKFAQKEVAQITKTKMGIEDKTEKSINSMVEHMKKNKFTLSSLYNSSFEEVSDIVGSYINEGKKKEEKEDDKEKLRMNNPEVVAANSKGKLLFDFDSLEEAEKKHGKDYSEYFAKQMQKYGAGNPGDLTKSQWTTINHGWTSKKEKLSEIATSGSAAVGAIGGEVVDGELGTTGNFKYAANPFKMDTGVMKRSLDDTNYSKSKKKRTLKKEYNTNSSAPYSYAVELNDGSGYVPKGMEKNYVMGQHEKNIKESIEKVDEKLNDSKLLKESNVKRKFLMKEEEGVNKRYIVTEKRSVDEEKDRWKKLSLFETYETIHKAESMCECMNECTCGDSYEDDEFLTMDQGQEENEREFMQRNQDAESGEFVDGKEVIIVAKPKSLSNAMYKVFKDDFMNENKAYILDLNSGNLVNNPNFKIGR